MFSSRTLTDRNNDPTPYAQVYFSEMYPLFSRRATSGSGAAYDPRPAYQYGTLPENPILTRFREAQFWDADANTPEAWLGPLKGEHPGGSEYARNPLMVAHAIRVLSLLAAVTR